MTRIKLFLTRILRRFQKQKTSLKDASLPLAAINSLDQYKRHQEANTSVYAQRNLVEKKLVGAKSGFLTPGHCYVCKQDTSFYSNFTFALTDMDGNQKPNWREHLLCPTCGLNNRMRAAVQIFEQLCLPKKDDQIYITEQTTHLYKWFSRNYNNITGSEYFGDRVPYGSLDRNGIRNETLTDLTFRDEQFNYILSFDVFEHIPDYLSAFRECLRCLQPGGFLFFSVPFQRMSEKNITRARVLPNGQIEHILPAEYHGDPLNSEGVLCYYHFGWELLKQLLQLGFTSATSQLYWSQELGYLGYEQIIFLAQKGD